MEARRHGWLVGAVAAFALGVFAPAAGAATANITEIGTEQVLQYDAAAGEVNNLWIEGGPQWQVAELKPADGVTPPVHITGDANCHAYPPPGDPIGADAVSCDTPDGLGGIDRVEINLGDQNDVVQIIAADVPIVINGGEGEDSFYDTDRTNVTLPVPRTFNGGLGDDKFIAGVDSGQPNDYHGDAGTDEMYYHWRSDSAVKRSQTITLDDVADDGANNEDGVNTEGDNVHSDIEKAFGSDQADVIKGTANGDYLVGNGGGDKIDGLGGNDRLFADDSHDTGQKICGADVLNGGEGDDELTLGGETTANGEAGADTIRSFPVSCPGGDVAKGGEGQDTFTFFDFAAPAPVVKGLKASLDGVANDGVGGRSNLATDIEELRANSGGMTLIGNDQANRLVGGAGDDVLDGRGGGDDLEGGLGADTADYSSRAEALSLTLDGVANDGATGENDLIRDDVENVRGGSGDDTIVGDAQKNVLVGGGGVDTIDAGAGDDEIDSNDDKADTDTCGEGADKVVRDDLDTVAADCETVGGPPTDPPTGPPTGAPTGPTTPNNPTQPTTPVVPIDKSAPKATLKMGTGKLGKVLSKGLAFTVKSNESGTLTAALTAESTTARVLERHGMKAKTVLWSGRANATGNATKTLTLRLTRKARRALDGVQIAKLKLVVTVTDRAGNKRTIIQHLRIRR